MLEAVQLPAGVTDLATSLADVDGDTLTLERGDKLVPSVNMSRYFIRMYEFQE